MVLSNLFSLYSSHFGGLDMFFQSNKRRHNFSHQKCQFWPISLSNCFISRSCDESFFHYHHNPLWYHWCSFSLLAKQMHEYFVQPITKLQELLFLFQKKSVDWPFLETVFYNERYWDKKRFYFFLTPSLFC